MNLLLAIPLELRLAGLAVLGALLGSLLNLAIYRWAWDKRSISPWSAPAPQAPPRTAADGVPIVGWLFLRREAPLHGRAFWLRPMGIELAVAFGLPWLYWWETVAQALCPFLPTLPSGIVLPPEVLHLQFLSHTLLIALMIVASFIDIDERLIPDQVTVFGTLGGLLLAALAPWSLLPELTLAAMPPPAELAIPLAVPPELAAVLGGNGLYLQFLTLASPNPWPAALAARPAVGPLLLALACYWLWIFAILPRPWYGRHGLRRALRVSMRRMLQALATPALLALLAAGTLLIVLVWWWGGAGWVGLLTALVGLVGSGGIVWAVRLIGAVTLRKEAMGFGDVLLMMMIGTFLGWQTCILVFFMAPFAGLLIGVLQLIIRRDQTIPYGPFLCLAALVSILLWARLWDWAYRIFELPWLVPGVLAACLVVMTVLLLVLRLVRESVFRARGGR